MHEKVPLTQNVRLQMKSFQTRNGETVFDTETALPSLRRPSGRVLTREREISIGGSHDRAL